jgi:hypothetical protein
MDNFIYSVPNYIVDWSKYIDIPNYSSHVGGYDADDEVTINLKKELYNFLNITDSTILGNHNNNNIIKLNNTTKNNHSKYSSKFSQKTRSKNRY